MNKKRNVGACELKRVQVSVHNCLLREIYLNMSVNVLYIIDERVTMPDIKMNENLLASY